METKMDLEKGLLSNGEGKKLEEVMEAVAKRYYEMFLGFYLIFCIIVIVMFHFLEQGYQHILVGIQQAILDTKCPEPSLYYS